MKEFFTVALIVTGVVLSALGVAGLYRFPDVFTRLHSARCAATGCSVVAVATALHGGGRFAVHALICAPLIFAAAAASVKLIARFALMRGVTPHKGPK